MAPASIALAKVMLNNGASGWWVAPLLTVIGLLWLFSGIRAIKRRESAGKFGVVARGASAVISGALQVGMGGLILLLGLMKLVLMIGA